MGHSSNMTEPHAGHASGPWAADGVRAESSFMFARSGDKGVPICMFIHIHVYTYIHIHIWIYMHIYICIYIYVYAYMHICKYICIYVNVYTLGRRKCATSYYYKILSRCASRLLAHLDKIFVLAHLDKIL